jgi:hypothetical protein
MASKLPGQLSIPLLIAMRHCVEGRQGGQGPCSAGVLVRKIQLYTALLYKGGADNAAIAATKDIVFLQQLL